MKYSTRARRFAVRCLPLLAVVLLLTTACASSPTTIPATPGKADATIAVNARSAIDQTEAVKVAACEWAIRAHIAGQLADSRYRQISTACDAVATAETIANVELRTYLASGSLDAKTALEAGLLALAAEQVKLLAAKGGT